MFLTNTTPFEAVCRRGQAAAPNRPTLRFATVMVHEAYDLTSTGSLKAAHDSPLPPDLAAAKSASAWDGSSVTATGTVRAPEHGMLARTLSLSVGAITRRLVARGPRHWVRDAAGVAPSQPSAWTPLALDWCEAFGGKVTREAARDSKTGLPHPRIELAHHLNPMGRGFAPSPEEAIGRPLPRLELLEDQVQAPQSLAWPGGFAPTPTSLAGLRITPPEGHPLHEGCYASLTRATQVAPGYLVFSWLAPGVSLAIDGLERAMRLALPGPSVKLRPKRPERTGARIRAAHLDTDAQRLHLVWQHAMVTSRSTLGDLRLELAEGAR